MTNENKGANKKTKYFTTPIYYANGAPHIGHFLTTTIADVLTRFYKKSLGNDNVFFTTGIDEHGTTVEEAAIKAGYALQNFQKYVDTLAVDWKKTFDDTNINYDYFVRTTDLKHKKFAQEFIQKMVDKGDVYKGTYKGKYCNGCEKFLTLSDLNEDGGCPLHRADQVIDIEEENWFFKLSKYAPKVKSLLEEGTIQVFPENKKREMIARINTGVDDLSISRPKEKVAWGVEFPNDKDQTVYVWVEALINYLSNLEINNKQDFWKDTVLLLAKDINWFHNVIWPAFLLSADYPLYKQAFVHSYLSVGGKKISKSLGTIITPHELIEKYGIGGARYLTLANIPYKNDTDITWKLLTEKYNADLANGLGNAVARVTKLAENSGFEFEPKEISENIWEEKWAEPIQEFKVDTVLQNIWQKLSRLDKHINENEPWSIKDETKLKEVLRYELDELREVAIMLEPFLPETSKKIQNQLQGPKVNSAKGLFPRIKE